MSKKHFIALADHIRNTNEHFPGTFNAYAIQALASWCYEQNFAFKKDRWVSYIKGECGPNGGAR